MRIDYVAFVMIALLLLLGLGIANYYGAFDYPDSEINIAVGSGSFNATEYYNITQIETILQGYYNISSLYNITEISNQFLLYYNITEVNSVLDGYYNKTDIDILLNGYSFTNHTHTYDYSDFANHTDIPIYDFSGFVNQSTIIFPDTSGYANITHTQVWYWVAGMSTDATNNAVHYDVLNGFSTPSSDATFRYVVANAAFNLSNLYINTQYAAGSGKNWTVDLYVNGAHPSNSPSCFFGTSDTTVTDTTNYYVCSVGDLITLRFTPTGTPAATKFRWSIKVTL